jgi:hypothetical protein
MAVSLAALTGCALIPPTAPSEINTRLGADGRVRQFFLGPQSSGQLTLGTARKLLFAVSSGAFSPRAESFRIQGEPSALPDPHGRFRESSRAIAEQAVDEPQRRLQDIQTPPKTNDIRTFWVNTGNSTWAGDSERPAKLIASTAHAHFFVDTESTLNHNDSAMKAQVQAMASAFEATIYPRVTQVFGAPPEPGIDGDPRVYVVISQAVDNFGKDAGLMGYFWSRDVHARSGGQGNVRDHSNEKEIIFLTDQIFKQKPWTTYGTLAHEFTHLVVYNQKVLVPARTTPEETWLDEGIAMLAMDLCGYGLRDGNDEVAKDIAFFQANPEKYSLTDWFRNPRGFSYGQSYLFTRYLYDRYEAGMIRDLIRSPQVGVTGVEQALAPRGISFEDVFSDWSIANAISGLGVTQEARYSYAPEINLRGNYGSVQLKGIQPRPLDGPADVTGPTRAWGTAYYLLGSPQDRTWTMDVRPGLGMFGGTVALP